MYGHEYESDEDCEVYFLKPVNEYNIVDKIKEANKELFADEGATDVSDGTTTMATNKKVTFALNLEDYEPVGELEKAAEIETDDKVEEAKNDFATALKFPAIDEQDEVDVIILEPQENEKVTRNNSETSDADPDTKLNEVHDIEAQLEDKTEENFTEVEEICEEIITMEMDESRTSSNDSQQQRNKMLKQATFDHDDVSNDDEDDDDDDDDDNDDDDTSDTKSLKELLGNDSKAVDESEDLADDEDDDQLSIILASYISDDYDKHALLVDSDFRRKHKFVKPKKNCFTKRFSFRRKSNNSNTTGNSNAERHMPPPAVTDLKLNYKTCCEYRHAVQEKLPKYTGYLSEYGLTREQLAKREEKWQQKQRFVLEKSLQANAQDMRKMQDNERAFTTWLKQKMRFPINKTRNMFDVKFSVGGGCSSGSAVRNRCNSGKIK